MANWSNEKILSFINKVHAHQELWNVDDPEYKDREKKKYSWSYIANDFDISSEEAYKKFKSLRTYAKNEQKKQRKRSGKQVSWFAYGAMSFVLARDGTDEGTDQDCEVNVFAEISRHSSTDSNIAEVSVKEEFINTEEALDPFAPSQKNKKRTTRETEPVSRTPKHRREYSSFGDYVAQKLSTYDRYTRAKVEYKISQALYEADMSTFKGNRHRSPSYSDTASPTYIEVDGSNYSPKISSTGSRPAK